jgi:hypothetical protein
MRNDMRGRLEGRAIGMYAFAGDSFFTVSDGTQRFTYSVKESDDGKLFFVKVLTHPGHYDYIGIVVKASRSYSVTKAVRMNSGSPSIVMFARFFMCCRERDYSWMEVWHEGVCGRCGRQLTVPESVASGFGPVCAGRISKL